MALVGQALYDEIVRHYVRKLHGCFVVISSDAFFFKVLKDSLKYLGLPVQSAHKTSEIGSGFKLLSELAATYKGIVVFLDANLSGRNTIIYFRQIKEIFRESCNIICLTSESGREKLIYIKEMGADNIVVKPVTMNSLIQKTALTIKPNTKFSRLVDSANKLISENKLFEAMQNVEQILKEKPDSTVAYMLKGDIFRKKKEYSEAENAYKMAIHNAELYIEPLKRLASLYAETEQLDNRLENLIKLDSLSPLNHERKIEIGNTFLDMNVSDKAKQYFANAVDLVQKKNDEVMAETLMHIGRQLSDKDPEGSLEYMQRAIALKEGFFSKDDIWMFNEIGLGFRKSGKPDIALEYYKKAQEVASDDGVLDYNIGMAMAESGDFAAAIGHFEDAIDKTPEILNHSPLIPYNIAMAYKKNHQLREAEQYFKICLVLDPHYKDVAAKIESLQFVD